MMRLFVKDREELKEVERRVGMIEIPIPTVFLVERRAYGWFLLEYPSTPALVDEERGIMLFGDEAVDALRMLVEERKGER